MSVFCDLPVSLRAKIAEKQLTFKSIVWHTYHNTEYPNYSVTIKRSCLYADTQRASIAGTAISRGIRKACECDGENGKTRRVRTASSIPWVTELGHRPAER